MAGSADPNTERILAYGLRNPFRWTFRPGTSEIWIADVGWRTWEEINRVVDPAAGPVRNYGWPCYEGNLVQSGYHSARLNLCESLYSAPPGTVINPYYTYQHSQTVAAGDGCPTGGSSPSGVAFYPTSGGGYPATYRGALFFSDYSRGCIWAMRVGTNGLPDPANVVPFSTAASPVDLQIGPDKDLYYVDLLGGTVRRFHYSSGNQPPTAVLRAKPTSGNAPLQVSFDASGSTDPNAGDILSYDWDFTNDGSFDASGITTSHTYPTPGTYTARLRVSDIGGLSHMATVRILVGTSAPEPVIDSPTAALHWTVGQRITFSGHATDSTGTLPASALSWQLINRHCPAPDNCHSHPMQEVTGKASGSFLTPDHEYPSHLELILTATGSTGLTGSTTVRLDPRTVDLSLASDPSGVSLNLDGINFSTPATTAVIVGSTTTLSAPSRQTVDGVTYVFDSWSDGGAQTHVVTAPATATTYTATYTTAGGCADDFGYTCTTVTGRAWVPADDTVLPLTGDDAITQVSLPFPVGFYGRTYRSAWVDVNGMLSFLDPGRSQPINGALPDPAVPNGAVYPFWDDLVLRADSSVRTGLSGSVPDRRFVVEWRNVGLYGSSSARVTFEVVFTESGQIIFNYANLNGTSRGRGDSATVGIENAAGTIGLPYSMNRAVLANGKAVIFTPPAATPPPPPAAGTVSGLVTAASTGKPVSGATVSLTPGSRSTTTAKDGTYQLTGVPPGSYQVTGAAAGGLTGQAPAKVVAGEAISVDLVLSAPSTAGSYKKSTESRPYVSATGDALALTGDDVLAQVSLPFAFPFYGRSQHSAWISSNGFLSFLDPAGPQPINGALPDPVAPNAAVYPFWDDLVLRADSSVRTEVSGSAPNRSFVVEWRNIGLYGSSSARVSFQVTLSERGEIVFNYADLNTTGRERGDSATVGIENEAGSSALQHSYLEPVLANGTAIIFRPQSG